MADPAESRWRLLVLRLDMVQAAVNERCRMRGLLQLRTPQLRAPDTTWVGIVSLIAAFIALVLLAFTRREAWWAPAISLGIILATTICTTIAISIGAQRPDALDSLLSLTT